VIAAQAGETSAVVSLFRTAWPAAYRIAWSILGNAAAAEDAAQSACARALGALYTLRRSDRFAPWFYRIVANEAKQLLRTTARELPLESVLGDRPASWRDEMGAHVDRIDVRQAIDALEPGLRATVVLRYYFGMSSAEIGRILGTSPVTARWRLMLAHRTLRARLQPAAGPDLRLAEEPCR
jgi:RNA polymerase sigma factor (sigma-70 family)